MDNSLHCFSEFDSLREAISITQRKSDYITLWSRTEDTIYLTILHPITFSHFSCLYIFAMFFMDQACNTAHRITRVCRVQVSMRFQLHCKYHIQISALYSKFLWKFISMNRLTDLYIKIFPIPCAGIVQTSV